MSEQSKRLGRGLADIISTTAAGADQNFVMLPVGQIRPGRYQPRSRFPDQAMEELKASIRQRGVIEPVIVRPVAHGSYELVAGERRFRAAQAIGLKEVPSIIRSLGDREALEYSLIENIQRENLNPVEEAKGYGRLLDEFGYTQEDIASAVGKDRATVANMLRILRLPADIQAGLEEGQISVGHAKVLVGVEGESRQRQLFERSVKGGLTVRQLEVLAGTWVPGKRRARRTDPQTQGLEDELRRALGTKVSVLTRKKGGRLVIEYFSGEELTRILQALGVSA